MSYDVGTSTGEGINIWSARSLSDIRYPQQEKPVRTPVCMHAGRTPTATATLTATRDTWIARGVAPTANDTAAQLLVEALYSKSALVQFATDTILRAAGGHAIVAARLELADARTDPTPDMQSKVVEVSRMLSDWSNDIPWATPPTRWRPGGRRCRAHRRSSVEPRPRDVVRRDARRARLCRRGAPTSGGSSPARRTDSRLFRSARARERATLVLSRRKPRAASAGTSSSVRFRCPSSRFRYAAR
jgi:hypothetical protein